MEWNTEIIMAEKDTPTLVKWTIKAPLIWFINFNFIIIQRFQDHAWMLTSHIILSGQENNMLINYWSEKHIAESTGYEKKQSLTGIWPM